MTIPNYSFSQQAYSQAVGTNATNYPVISTRDPTQFDVVYQIGRLWQNTTDETLWFLNSQSNASGQLISMWVPLTAGASSGIEKVLVDTFTPPGTNPVLPTANQITVTGGQVAAGTTANVIQTDSLAASTFTIQIQRSQAVSSSTVGDNGVSHFNSAQFTVDANAFVSITNFTPFAYVQVTGPATYNALTTDYYISCNPTGGTISIVLPAAPVQYHMYVIKDRTGAASINNITVSSTGGVLIDGAASYVLAGNFSAITLLFNGSNYEIY